MARVFLMKKAKGAMSIKLVLILVGLLPMILTASAVTFVASMIVVENLETNIHEELMVASQGLKKFYENLIETSAGFPPRAYDYVDSMKAMGVDLTVFKENIRYITSITDDKGARIENTKASDTVWEIVKDGRDYYDDNVIINGAKYHVYYMPLEYNDKVIGMTFAGKSAEIVDEAEWAVTKHIVWISALAILLFLLFSIMILGG